MKHIKIGNPTKVDELFPPVVKDEDYKIVEMMEKYGGSFVKALAGAFYRADINNFSKLKRAFPEYWKEYKDFIK